MVQLLYRCGQGLNFPATYTGVDLTGILGGRMAGLNIKVLLYRQKHIFLHCSASNLVLKILQHDKIWGTIPPLQILWGLVRDPVIYAHGHRPIHPFLVNRRLCSCKSKSNTRS